MTGPVDRLPRYRFDVVVVGGGLAAVQAAASAAESGASVGVISKRRVGKSGSSAMTSGGYAAVLPGNEPTDSPAAHFEDTIEGGGGIADPELVRVLCDEGPLRVRELEALGGAFRKTDGEYVLSASGDHSRVRSLGAEHHIGTDFTVPLAEYALSLGVRPFEFAVAVDLLLDEGRVAGALVLDTKMGTLSIVEAACTILATGGCGQLFPVTSNPKDVTGDGFSMAARAGAILRDMEFIQFYPWRCIDPFTQGRVSIQPATFTVGGKLYNAANERFMMQYEPERLEAATRDVSARAIFDQVRRGLGINGGVRLDLSDIPPEVIEETNPKVVKGLQRREIDYRSYPFIVAPEAHYFMGGARIDAYGRCSVERLYAAGEAAGGIQGGNRLSNNALPEALVFGRRAGIDAARAARDGEQVTPDEDHLAECVQRVDKARTMAGGGIPVDRAAVQEVALHSLGIIREEKALRAGLDRVQALKESVEASATADPGELAEWFALHSLLEVAELCLVPALERKESRAAHFREDYPHRDDEQWLGSLLVQRHHHGRVMVTFAPSRPLAPTTGEGTV